jgi:hypothetical protein
MAKHSLAVHLQREVGEMGREDLKRAVLEGVPDGEMKTMIRQATAVIPWDVTDPIDGKGTISLSLAPLPDGSTTHTCRIRWPTEGEAVIFKLKVVRKAVTNASVRTKASDSGSSDVAGPSGSFSKSVSLSVLTRKGRTVSGAHNDSQSSLCSTSRPGSIDDTLSRQSSLAPLLPEGGLRSRRPKSSFKTLSFSPQSS